LRRGTSTLAATASISGSTGAVRRSTARWTAVGLGSITVWIAAANDAAE
jgi:hypothetical protein